MKDLKKLISEMTLEEKAGICSGADFWHTKAVERLQIPDMMMSDGPHGLRKQDLEGDHLGVNDSIKAVCFPAGCAMASSFDRELLHRVGETLGKECQAENVGVILGPAVNIKRSPLCGRNFEYYSEDPYAASEIATAHIEGVQSQNVGTSIKHFCLNNQETRRMSISAEVDERTMHEIYLSAFEGAVKNAKPWTVMCSYNRINGVFGSENQETLTDILRKRWGYEGFVVSDWSAVNDRVPGLKAGLDLEMPSSFGENDALIVEAVKKGELDEAVVDQAVERILNIVYRAQEGRKENAVFDRDADHELAREIAGETLVLLKNEDHILPLSKEQKLAVIGKYAKKPRFQGGGSSHINCHKVTAFLDCLEEGMDYVYAQGYDDDRDEINEQMIAEAVEAAKDAAVAVIFAGLPDNFESEGYDRKHMRMPDCQNELIRRVTEVQKNVIVILHNGSPVEMPWISEVKGVIEAYLGGQAVGGAEYDVLFGRINPSGKLSETFPLKLSDNPSYLNFPGGQDTVEYKEGIFVGYRYYDFKEMDVLFPFGYGLSYTDFAYSNLKLDKETMKDSDTLTVSVDVTNTGKMAGKEVVEVYVRDLESSAVRPVRELKEFTKVALEPGETKTVTFALSKRSFAYYEPKVHDFYVEPGDFLVEIGRSSRDIVLSEKVTVTGTYLLADHYDENSLIGDAMRDERVSDIVKALMENGFMDFGGSEGGSGSEAISKDMMAAMFEYTPLRSGLSFSNGRLKRADLQEVLKKMNERIKK